MADYIGGRTGKPVLDGKVPRRDSDGWELFTDYFSATEDSQTPSPSKRQDGAEEQPQACESPMFLDESLVLDSLEGSWMEGDSRAGSPVIHPEDVSAGGHSSHLYFVELMRRHEATDLHNPGNEDFNGVAESISPTKTDIEAIVALPDLSTNDEPGPSCSPNMRATGLSDVASEELEMEAKESWTNSGAAKRDAQLECDDPLAFPLACFGTEEEKPGSLSPLLDKAQLHANFWRHPLFQTDEDISQLVRSSDTSEGHKWPKKALTNVSEVAVLDGPKIIWPHAGTSHTKPGCTEGELCKKFEWRELGAFQNSVSKGEPHKSALRKKTLPLLLPAPKAERQPTERETENSDGMPLISRDLWSSGDRSKSAQGPSARFTQWANNLGQDSGLKSTSEGPSGSSQLGHMSSKTGHHAQGGDGASGAAAAKNPNSESAHPVKGKSGQEAPKSPEEGSLWHSLRCQQEMPEICFWPDVPLTTRKNSSLLIAPTELKQLPLQNQKASGEKTSFWSRPKSSALGSQLLGGSPTASAATELNQQPSQNQKASGEKTSFWSRPKSSALGSQSSGSSCAAIAPTELNQQPLQNQQASGEKTSFWSRPKSSSLGSQSSGSSCAAIAPTELNQQPLQNQQASGEKTSFWSRPKSSSLGSQSSGSSCAAIAPTELNQQPLQNQQASGEKTSFWSRPKSSSLGSQSSGSSQTAIAPTELSQQSWQNQKASGKKPSFWSRPKLRPLGSQVSEGAHTANPSTEFNQHPLQNQAAFEEKTSFWSRPRSSALGFQVLEGLRTASAPVEPDQQPSKNQKASGGKPSFWSRPKSSAFGSQSSEGSHTASAPAELNQQPLQNQKASGEKPSFWSRPKSSVSGSQSSGSSRTAGAPTELNEQPLQNQKASGEKTSFWSRPRSRAFGSQSSAGSHTASAPTELNEQPLQNQKASGEKTSFWSRPKSSALGSQVSEGSHTAGAPIELNQHPVQNQAVLCKKTSLWSRPRSSALGSQASETGHGLHQKSGVEPMATVDLSCLYSSGKNGSDAGRNTLPNVPVDKSKGNTANSTSVPAKRLGKRRPLLLPGPLKRPAACLEVPPSSALELLNPAQTMVNKFPKSPRKDDVQMETEDMAAKMRKCDTQCETKDNSTQTAGPKAEPQETSAQTSFICVLGKRVMLDNSGMNHLRETFHMKQEELKFIDMSLQGANENTPVSFASYVTTKSVTVGRLRLGSNQEKPPATNTHSDTVLIPQDHSVKVATIGQGWLLLTKGSSFFVRRGVPFSLKNVGAATAEILYVLSQPC